MYSIQSTPTHLSLHSSLFTLHSPLLLFANHNWQQPRSWSLKALKFQRRVVIRSIIILRSLKFIVMKQFTIKWTSLVVVVIMPILLTATTILLTTFVLFVVRRSFFWGMASTVPIPFPKGFAATRERLFPREKRKAVDDPGTPSKAIHGGTNVDGDLEHTDGIEKPYKIQREPCDKVRYRVQEPSKQDAVEPGSSPRGRFQHPQDLVPQTKVPVHQS